MEKLLLCLFSFFTLLVQSQTRIDSALTETLENSNWSNLSGVNYEYDSNDNLISITEFRWEQNQWENSYKFNYSYNSNGKIVEQIEQIFDIDQSQYNNSFLYQFTYDSNGQLIARTKDLWDNGSWEDENKYEYTYTNCKINNITMSAWNPFNNQWEYLTRATPTYTGDLIAVLDVQSWDGSNWVIDEQIPLTYNSNEQIIKYAEEFWDGSNWHEEEARTYEYDNSGNRTKKLYSFEGFVFQRDEYQYDTSESMSNFTHPFEDKSGYDYLYESFPYSNKILGFELYELENSTSDVLVLSQRTTYNYGSTLFG